MERTNVWLQSGLPAMVKGIRLIPQQHPRYKNLAYVIDGQQGKCLFLNQPGTQRTWVIKKFNPEMTLDRPYLSAIRALVPNEPSCIAASKRYLVASADIKNEEGLYYSNELATLLDNSILMPEVKGETWKNISQSIRSGKYEFSLGKRVAFAKSLVATVIALEKNGCVHRELCSDNLILNFDDNIVYLIDWDSMYNGSLYFQKSLPAGAEGYIAPWVVDETGRYDARKTWNAKGDRFSLAIVIAEFLLVDKQSPRYYNGALFSQEILQNPKQLTVQRYTEQLNKMSESVGDLFKQTLFAGSFETCPEPYRWIRALESIQVSDEEKKEAEAIEIENIDVKKDALHETGHHDTFWLFLFLIGLPLVLGLIYWGQESEWFNSSSTTVNMSDDWFKKVEKINAESAQPRENVVRAVTQEELKENPMPDTRKNYINDYRPAEQTTEQRLAVQARMPERYSITIEYPDIDLKMKLDNKDIPLDARNSAVVEVTPGYHEVHLFFTSINENFERDEAVSFSSKIMFDQKRDIKLRINRKDKTWREVFQ